MDKKAKKILFDTFWKSGGWIDAKDRKLDVADFNYAKSKKLMFGPITIHHDDCINQLQNIVDQISEESIIKAFLSSLSTRNLAHRSARVSYYLAKSLPKHKYTPVVSGTFYDNGVEISHSFTCAICRDAQYGIIGDEKYTDYDLNILNFERFKWGGVRLGDIIYMLFDLKRFQEEKKDEVTNDDIQIFRAILDTISTSSKDDYPSKLVDRLKDNLKSTKDERTMLIEIMAALGILSPKAMNRPIKGKNDWVFVEQWRGEDAYNETIVKKYFGTYLSKHV